MSVETLSSNFILTNTTGIFAFPMDMKMIDQFILGGAIASLLGFLLLYYTFQGKKKSNRASMEMQRDEYVKNSQDGECQQEIAGNTEIIIVGAGVAGSALACTLGKDGRQVLVIERDLTEPDRIVGELLQPGGYLKLIELGLEDCVNEIDAQRVFGYALFKDGKNTKLSYPLKDFHSDVAGRSFHNGRFIQRMREKAASIPNVRLEQGTVTSLVEEKGTIKGVQYKTKTGEEMTAYAPLTIVCDGCFSNLRRSLCNPKVNIPSCFVALILKNCELPYKNHGHVILANPSPILLYQISSTEIRCLVDVPGQKVPSISNGEMAHYLKTNVAPQIPVELYYAFISAIEEGNIRTMPNRSMPAAPYPTPGAILLGDAFNMRHPLTGGGMTVALSDIVVLRDLLRPLHNLSDASSLCKYLESFYTLRKPVASTINTLASALYKVFCASPNQARNEMRQACFDYLSLGGIFSNGPVALLSGLNPRPLSLVLHFFAVAIYGVGRLLLPFPSPKRVIASLFAFVLLYSFQRKRKNNERVSIDFRRRDEYVKSSEYGECRPDDTERTDIIIVGAGVAGSALAYTLGKDGRRVHVIERDLTEPDRIVGELLQPGGYLKLIELGLEDFDAQQVFGYALFKDGKNTTLSYPLENFHSDVAGRSFHHGRFIQRMQEKAASLSNLSLEQGTVTSLLKDNGTIKGVQYKTKIGNEMTAYAPLTIVCDGCFSNLWHTLCKPKVDVPSCFVGLVLENCQLPYANHGHVILADPSPILFYPISNTEIRCLVDVPGEKIPFISNGEMAHYLKTKVASQIPHELFNAFISAIDRGNFRAMLNRTMPAAPLPTVGALLMGGCI
ncbi:hypothetical protein F0562_020832 [Nyssa sinensis]|uniref:squalene monooxygenase n=1 Tax=Nyssa sinensis TaxID=561372 RepID=A0A5J5BSR6_9ASTE|nr:hypothetical protein F0562_020832 [Nyssa sinensis]